MVKQSNEAPICRYLSKIRVFSAPGPLENIYIVYARVGVEASPNPWRWVQKIVTLPFNTYPCTLYLGIFSRAQLVAKTKLALPYGESARSVVSFPKLRFLLTETRFPAATTSSNCSEMSSDNSLGISFEFISILDHTQAAMYVCT